MSEQEPTPKSAAARLFDIRFMIGGLFVVYGVILVIAGIADGPAEIQKAAGINMNLWLGLGMLVVGLLFLLWMRLNPNKPDPAPDAKSAPSDDRPSMH